MEQNGATLAVVLQMKKMLRWWPFVLKSTYENLRRENWELRGALSRANEELRKHRMLIGGLRNQQAEVVRAVEKVITR